MTPRKKRRRYQKSAIAVSQRLGIEIDANNWEEVWNLLDKEREPEYLYVIADFEHRMVKFGRSRSPITRLSSLNTGNGVKLELWGYCPHESPFTEKEVHALLTEFRLTGEWFRLAAPVQSVINAVRAVGRTA